MTEYQTHAALVATLETEIVRLRAVNAELRKSIQAPVQPDTKLVQAARQALEALEPIHPGNMTPMAEEAWKTAITALREALEAVPQPAAVDQEPVAYASRIDTNWPVLWSAYQVKRGDAQYPERLTPLYTAPQPAAAEQRPVAYLHCGGQFGGELDEWEIDPEQYQCDKLNEHFGALGKEARVPLFTAPQPTAVEQEPVAWIANEWSVFNTGAEVASGLSLNEAMDYLTDERAAREWSVVCVINKDNMPTRAAPQPARQPLTDKQIQGIWCSAKIEGNQHGPFWFARAVERAHGIGGEA
jgi:hypothetical protein